MMDKYTIRYTDISCKAIGLISERMIPFQDKTSAMWGYADTTGKEVISAQYYEALPFSENTKTLCRTSEIENIYDFAQSFGFLYYDGTYFDIASQKTEDFHPLGYTHTGHT